METASWVTDAYGLVGAKTLIDKGVDMFVSIGYPESLPAIVEAANVSGMPIVTSTMSYLPTGAHVVSGFCSYYEEEQIIGRMLVAELQGIFGSRAQGHSCRHRSHHRAQPGFNRRGRH